MSLPGQATWSGQCPSLLLPPPFLRGAFKRLTWKKKKKEAHMEPRDHAGDWSPTLCLWSLSNIIFCWNKILGEHFGETLTIPTHLYRLPSEKVMAPHSSTLAWKIPWMEEPGRLQSMGSLRVRHNLATSLSLFTFMHWRRKWQPTPVFLPGESQGWGSLVGCHLWGGTESDMTDVT